MQPTESFTKCSRFSHPAAELFNWHCRPGALQRLTPPWSGVQVESQSGSIAEDGSVVVLRMPIGPIGCRWVATHRDFVPGRSFRDEQTSGPFAFWNHTHTVEAAGAGSTLKDHIDYRLPIAPLSTVIAGSSVQRMLKQTFAWRHRRTAQDLDAHARSALTPLRVAISGATGLVGAQLAAFLSTGGHDVHRIVRRIGASPNEVLWNPAERSIDAPRLEGMEAVVHLAGEGIASGRWSDESKRRVLASRVEGTRLLCETLATLTNKPKVLICASAVGFYGDRGQRRVDETDEAGTGFLAEVCRRWEAATEPARRAGIRVVNLRLGVVLTPLGGALAQMLMPFRLGLGGKLGSGAQFVSWISLDDVLGAILHSIASPQLEGPVNATAPTPVTNLELTSTLGEILRRPTLASVPTFALRTLLGEMADELLLASTCALPRRLQDSGFVFRDDGLRGAIASMLGRSELGTQ